MKAGGEARLNREILLQPRIVGEEGGGVDHRPQRGRTHQRLQFRRLHHAEQRGDIGDPRRLDQDAVGRLRFDHRAQAGGDVTAERTADAAIGQLDHLCVAALEQPGVDAEFAEVVDQHDRLLRRISRGEQPLEEGRLAGAEKADDDLRIERLGGAARF